MQNQRNDLRQEVKDLKVALMEAKAALEVRDTFHVSVFAECEELLLLQWVVCCLMFWKVTLQPCCSTTVATYPDPEYTWPQSETAPAGRLKDVFSAQEDSAAEPMSFRLMGPSHCTHARQFTRL